jgi:hypothetical protein
MMPIRSMLLKGGGGGGGGGGATIPLSSPYSEVFDPSNASAVLTYDNAGNCSSTGEGSNTWIVSGSPSDYDIRLTITGGSTPTGAATGTWLSLGTTRVWSLSQTVPGANTSTGDLEIRQGVTVVASASFTAQAIVN